MQLHNSLTSDGSQFTFNYRKHISIGANWGEYAGRYITSAFIFLNNRASFFHLWIDELSIVTIAGLYPKKLFFINHSFNLFQNILKFSEFDVWFINRRNQFPFDQITITQFIDPMNGEFLASYFFLLNSMNSLFWYAYWSRFHQCW